MELTINFNQYEVQVLMIIACAQKKCVFCISEHDQYLFFFNNEQWNVVRNLWFHEKHMYQILGYYLWFNLFDKFTNNQVTY